MGFNLKSINNPKNSVAMRLYISSCNYRCRYRSDQINWVWETLHSEINLNSNFLCVSRDAYYDYTHLFVLAHSLSYSYSYSYSLCLHLGFSSTLLFIHCLVEWIALLSAFAFFLTLSLFSLKYETGPGRPQIQIQLQTLDSGNDRFQLTATIVNTNTSRVWHDSPWTARGRPNLKKKSESELTLTSQTFSAFYYDLPLYK